MIREVGKWLPPLVFLRPTILAYTQNCLFTKSVPSSRSYIPQLGGVG